MKSILLTLVTLFGTTAMATTEVTIFPGGYVHIQAGEAVGVSCEGNGGAVQDLTICECHYNRKSLGQAVSKGRHSEQCKLIHQYSKPNNCISAAGPVICDCIYNQGVQGQVVGTDDHLQQCKDIHQYSKPANCKGR